MSMTGFSGSDDVLACFVAGNAFSWDAWFKKQTEEAHFQDVIDMMLNLAIFVYIGAIIPWNDFHNLSLGLTPWRLVLLAILILIFRRLPIVMLLKPLMPAMKTYREAAFSGYFGPMGVGAVFLSKIAKEELEKVYINADPKPIVIDLINPVVLAIVLSSVLVHGTTIPLFQLGKRIRSRTLSITSLNSHASQVLHLPLFQHRKSEDDILHHQKNKNKNKNHHHQQKEHHYHYSNNKKNSMTELQRNTLYNTIQGERPKIPLHGTPTTATSSSSTLHKDNSLLPMYQDNNHKDDDDDDDDIGDYLPDNSHFSATASLQNESFTYFNDDDYENTTTTVNTTDDDTLDQDKEEEEKQQLPLPQPSFKQDNGNNNSNISRCGSDSSLEMQGIRFVEPIKPRFSSSQTNLSLHENHGMANIKQWIYKHTSMEHHHHSSKKESVIIMEESLDDSTNNNESIKQQHHSGLRHFFKLNHNDHQHQHQNNNTVMDNDHNINEDEDEKKKMKHESGSSTK
ncbi:Sodium/hydrogen exchanger family-domain-containing protein [Cunninghamella echinulata]|nr:Sodium/hydrogen exchanger family-domain-containing protein [Cunninghamella echinulata]